jgi:hypothetical protein
LRTQKASSQLQVTMSCMVPINPEDATKLLNSITSFAQSAAASLLKKDRKVSPGSGTTFKPDLLGVVTVSITRNGDAEILYQTATPDRT